MNKSDCEKISCLLPLYTEGKTDGNTTYEIEQHLAVCSECFEKFIKLQNISKRIKAAFDNINNANNSDFQRDFFEKNLSAYIDNEMEKDDYFSFSRYVALNPEAKRELDEMIYFDKKLQESLEQNKKTLDFDLSKQVVKKIKNEKPINFYEVYLKPIALIVLFIVLIIATGYFSVLGNFNIFTKNLPQNQKVYHIDH